MKLTKQTLKQIIKEELGEIIAEQDSDAAALDILNQILAAVKSVDTSLDYVAAALTGESPLSISAMQKSMGRWAAPGKRHEPAPVKEEKE
jgi:hypothetical protein